MARAFPNLDVSIEGRSFEVELDGQSAPNTLAALLSALPMELPLHAPKIAGTHLYWHAPFIEQLEGARDILALPVGSFVYWPERQFLEIIFEPLQPEKAYVTYLGVVRSGIEDIALSGHRVRRQAGSRPLTISLRASGSVPKLWDGPGRTIALGNAVREVWAREPHEIIQMLASREYMHPIGPLAFAESEMRCLHELLWCYRDEVNGRDLASALAIALRKSASRVGGFCRLSQAAKFLSSAAELLEQRPTEIDYFLDDTILYVGKYASWLDLKLPWGDMNCALRSRLSE